MGIEVVYGESSYFKDYSKKYGNAYDLVIISRLSVVPSFIENVNLFYSNAKIIYDTVDLSFSRVSMQASIEKNEELALIAQQLKKIELGSIQRTNATLVVSSYEKKILASLLPNAKIEIVSNIHTIKNSSGLSFSKRKDLIFIGSFNHQPNVDAMIWFCNNIMPLIQKDMPDIKLKIIGSNPPKSIFALKSPNIEVLGYVEDVSSLFTKARIFIAPLRYGAGVKGKIGQAIEYGLPVVSTTLGVEGMHLKNNEHCLVADSESDFSKATIRLYHDKVLWEKISQNSQEILVKYFSQETAKKNLLNLLNSL